MPGTWLGDTRIERLLAYDAAASATMSGSTVTKRRRRRVGARRWPLLLPFLGLAVAAVGIYLVERDGWRRGAEIARAEAAAAEERRALLAAGELGASYAYCEAEWQAIGAWVWPLAVAYSRQELVVYSPLGVDGSSWQQLVCDEQGVRRGPRSTRPWRNLLPAEAPVEGLEEDSPTPVHVVSRLAGASLAFDELALEAGVHPVTGELVVRRWRGLEGGATPAVDPADAPELPSLLTTISFSLAAGVAAPPPLEELRRYRWADESDAAFDLLERSLPRGATIAELTLDDERLAVTIDWPTPGFDGDPPAPYGDLEWDAYAVADRDWWYPRTSPGFGCPRGRSLAAVRAAYAETPRPAGSASLVRAWYSCSPAWGGGDEGVWHLVARAP